MFLTINNEVIGSGNWPSHASCPPWLLNVSWRERTVGASALRIRQTTDIFDYHPLLWQTSGSIRRRYSVKYQSFVYERFVWEIHVRYNNKYLVIFDLSRVSVTNFCQIISAHCSYHFSTSNVLRLRCNNTFIFLWRFQWYNFKLAQFGWKTYFLKLLF